ncbi:Hint domain-containing protein [Pontibacter silvestris]|uniref:Hint domain-containing protein n=1 Tax=Pontibacter silvestris TaxID=2305183 RepID=A0ABW4X1D8_9BACT|nr:Hint domain-containing protein [Pontibacter silvestris]MCC9135966.1 Hint domain-containing protein [Pontibacter silvestris]
MRIGVIALVLTLFAAKDGFGQGEAVSFTLDDYKKFVAYTIGNVEEDTYIKFENSYVLDRETKPYVFNYSDGVERRIYFYKMLKGANRDEVGTMAMYTTPKSGKTIKVCIPGPKAEKNVWDFYIDELKHNGEQENGFLSTLTFALSREYSKEHANQGKNPVAQEDDHYDFCFPAGALVALADGTQKPIEQIEAGDKVMAYSAASQGRNETTVSDVQVHYRKEGIQVTKLLLAPVEEIFASVDAYSPSGLVEIEATNNHPLYTKVGKKEVGQIKEGDVLYYYSNSMHGFREYRVAHVFANNQQVKKVYNLETEAGNYLINGTVVLDK